MVTFAELAPVAPTPRRRTPAEVHQIGEEIAEIAAYHDAAVYEMLVRLREFERDEGWSGGFVSCAHWLSWRIGIDRGAAREKVRVARALEHLPAISGRLRTAHLSYTKVRALTRIATPDNEARLVEFALTATAAQVERMVRAWRRVDRQEEADAERARHQRRFLDLLPDGEGMFDLRGKLDPEVAMALRRALEKAGWELYREPGGTAESSVAQRRADAVGLVAEWALAADTKVAVQADEADAREATAAPATTSADHRLVIVHVDDQVLRSDAPTGDALLEDGTRVSAETSRRFACDASRVTMAHGPDGSVLGVGERRRTVPPRVRRALDQRDGGCRFPGCGSRFCDAHHVVHWADGGATRLDNLVLLCRIHHRAVHEDGFGVEIVAGRPRFRWPDGGPFPDVPPPAGIVGDADRAQVLRATDDRLAVQVRPETTGPFGGERMDLDYAIAVLWQPGSSAWLAALDG